MKRIISILVLVILTQIVVADYSVGDKIVDTMTEMSEKGVIILSQFEIDLVTEKDDLQKFRYFMAKLREIFREKDSYKISAARDIINQYWPDKSPLNTIFTTFYKPIEEIDFVIQQTLF